MFVTPDFVFIHLPKTGGTFVHTMLDRLHPQRLERLKLRACRKLGLPVTIDLPMHGHRRLIPAPFLDRPVLTCVRNPLDHYVSMFAFDRHRKHPEQFGGANPVIAHRWPGFPDLAFEPFVHYLNQECTFLRFPGFDADDQPGLLTQHFIYFNALNLEQTVRDLTPDAVRTGRLHELLPNMHYLLTHDLGRSLHDTLAGFGYAPRRITPILDAGRILPADGGRDESDHWSTHYTPQLSAYVRHKERLLLELFPQLDAHANLSQDRAA